MMDKIDQLEQLLQQNADHKKGTQLIPFFGQRKLEDVEHNGLLTMPIWLKFCAACAGLLHSM